MEEENIQKRIINKIIKNYKENCMLLSTPTANAHPVLTDYAPCFNKGTKILVLKNGIEEYELVENLKIGDMVKTFKHGYRPIIFTRSGQMTNNPTSWKKSMWLLTKDKFPDLTEDLIVTGMHGILVDTLGYEHNIHRKIYKEMVDGKFILVAGKSKKCKQIMNTRSYTYYHFAVENDGDKKRRYGVYANGLLTETPPEEHFYKFPHGNIKKSN